MSVAFGDLLDIRSGNDPLFLSGAGDTLVAPLTSSEQWCSKAEALRELFRSTWGTIPEGVDAPLNPETISEEKRSDHILRKVLFNVEKGERIDGYLLLPKNRSGKIPAALCLTPTTAIGKEQTIGNGITELDADRTYALHLVERGYATFTFDWDASGTRQYPGLEPFDNGPFYEKHPNWSAVGKNIWDIGKALDYLCSLDEVDSSRIASIGHSQGGGGTIYAMAMDERIKVGVSSCGGFPIRMDRNPYHEARNRWWIGRPALRPYFLTGKPVPCDIHELLALCAPRPFLYIAALNDCQQSIEKSETTRLALENMADNVKRIYSLLSAEECFDTILHTDGHSFISARRTAAYAFLDKYLNGNAN